MCGIVGAISQRIERVQFDAALQSLAHRGPDHIGMFREDQVWLGHTRLAINDLSESANQPFYDSVSECTVIFNGEIYNYRALRASLLCSGPFYSDSEAEVLARLYSIHADSMVGLLDGMFAFVIYDHRHKRLFGARDRLGKKPFFFHLSSRRDEFYFSSELKAFRHFPLQLSLDTRILDNILNFSFYEGESILQDIQTLPAGGKFTLDLPTFRYHQSLYFQLHNLIDPDQYRYWEKIGISGAENELKKLLEKAVEKRLVSDVPVAIIASGGLDSSLLSVIANNIRPYNLLHVDSVDSSELVSAKNLSAELGVELLSDRLDYPRFFELISETISHWEYPLVHTNATGILLVARLARRNGYKVILGGEGADELFGGYPQHRQYYLSQLINKTLKWVPTPLCQSLIYARSNNKGGGLEPTIQHLINRERFLSAYEKYGFVRSVRDRQVQSFLATELSEYLVPLLSRADRMSMAYGVEMRLPFLDMEIVRMALNLPLRYRITLLRQKLILSNIGKKLLKRRNPAKGKIGFSVNYAQKFIECQKGARLKNLESYLPVDLVMGQLEKSKQYHKMLRLYSIDQLCGELL